MNFIKIVNDNGKYKFVELIKQPILEDEVESWKNLSMKKLGDGAIKNEILIDFIKILKKR